MFATFSGMLLYVAVSFIFYFVGLWFMCFLCPLVCVCVCVYYLYYGPSAWNKTDDDK